MKMTYVPFIQGNMKGMKTIYTTRATSRIIDGSYNSIYKGRSMNFDELREYVAGDDIKDVDWNATARSQKVLVRQYIAEKKHNIMLVLDTNRRMLANANETQEKKNVALMAAGTLACMVSANGDYISATYSDKSSIRHFPFKTGLFNVENIMAAYDRDTSMDNDSDLSAALEFISKNIRRKMIMLIVTDMDGMNRLSGRLLKQLKATNDILLICVDDVDIKGKRVYDMAARHYLPDFISEDKKIARNEKIRRQKVAEECAEKMKSVGITYQIIDSTEDMDEKIAELLGRHRQEESILHTYEDAFAQLGFEIDAFGGNEYALRSVPVDLYGCSERELFLAVLDELSQETGNRGSFQVIEEKIASMSCKAAVKGNNRLSFQEAEKLIDELLTLDNPYNCPHGRPTIITMTETDLEKKFKRIV